MASRLFWRTTPDYSSLPDEIKEQIFLKLQCIKSIVTCTSVCKSWYAVIKSPGFITMQLSHPNNNTEYFLCSYYQPPFYSIQYYDSERLQNHYDLKFPTKNRVTVHGSCNGLICYTRRHDGSHNIYLWNPTIRKLKILPKSSYYTKRTAYGFWFDRNSDDYKVAKISCTKRSKVEVYSLSSNSWDIISTSGPRDSKQWTYFDNVLHVNGTLYWLASKSNNCRIISLNTKNGMFQDTLIWSVEKRGSGGPWFVLNTLGADSSLFVLRDSDRSMGVQVYDENLNEIFRNEVEKRKTVLRPLGVRNNGDEVLFQKLGTDPPILACNIGELKLKSFCPSTRTIDHVLPFVETLVLLDGGGSSSTSNTQ